MCFPVISTLCEMDHLRPVCVVARLFLHGALQHWVVEQSAIQVERLVGAFELLSYLPTSCLQRHVCARLAEH
jgi:hypothetical protein